LPALVSSLGWLKPLDIRQSEECHSREKGNPEYKGKTGCPIKFGHDNGQDKDFHWSLTQYFIFDGNDDTGD